MAASSSVWASSFVALPGKQQAEREVRLEGIGVGFEGAAVKAGSGVEMILVVGDVAGVEEGAGVGCVGGEISIEFGCGRLPVGFGNGSFSIGQFGRQSLIGSLRRIGCRLRMFLGVRWDDKKGRARESAKENKSTHENLKDEFTGTAEV